MSEAASHHWEAEYWMSAASEAAGRRLRKYRAECLARAQVHATLALVPDNAEEVPTATAVNVAAGDC